MKKVNFITDHTGASQTSFFLVDAANKLSDKYNVTIFYDQLQRPCRRILVPCMMLMEAWAQPGISIATSVSTASRLIDFPGSTRKLFYVWDMMWTQPDEVGQFHHIFRNPEIELIARNILHAKAISTHFNVKVRHVLDNFDIEKLTEVIEK